MLENHRDWTISSQAPKKVKVQRLSKARTSPVWKQVEYTGV